MTKISKLDSRVIDGMIQELFFCTKVVWHDDEPYRVDEDKPTGISLEFEVPFYSSNIREAWHVVRVLRRRGMTVKLDLGPEVVEAVVVDESGKELTRASADIAARALSEAVVKMYQDD